MLNININIPSEEMKYNVLVAKLYEWLCIVLMVCENTGMELKEYRFYNNKINCGVNEEYREHPMFRMYSTNFIYGNELWSIGNDINLELRTCETVEDIYKHIIKLGLLQSSTCKLNLNTYSKSRNITRYEVEFIDDYGLRFFNTFDIRQNKRIVDWFSIPWFLMREECYNNTVRDVNLGSKFTIWGIVRLFVALLDVASSKMFVNIEFKDLFFYLVNYYPILHDLMGMVFRSEHGKMRYIDFLHYRIDKDNLYSCETYMDLFNLLTESRYFEGNRNGDFVKLSLDKTENLNNYILEYKIGINYKLSRYVVRNGNFNIALFDSIVNEFKSVYI